MQKKKILCAMASAMMLLGLNSIAPSPAQANGNNNFAASVKTNGKWGVVNQEGTLIIPAEYDKIDLSLSDPSQREEDLQSEPNRSDFIEVQKGKLRGFYNRQGKEIVPVSYISRSAWKDGFLAAEGSNKKIGFFKQDGTVLADYQYQEASDFKNGLAVIKKENKYGYLKETGKEIQPVYEEAKYFSDHLAPVKKDGKWAVIDESGHEILSPSFEDAGPYFSQGLLAVKEKGQWGFINSQGNFIIPAKYQKVHPLFQEGYTAVQDKNKLWGFVDDKGNVTAEPVFKEVLTPFSEGLAGVASADGTGYARYDGTMAFLAPYDRVFPFHDGIAEVRQQIVKAKGRRGGFPISIGIGWGHWFHHHDGFGWGIGIPIWGWDPWYDDDWYNMPVLTAQERRGYINQAGQVIAAPTYDHVFPITAKGILVENQNRYGWINKDGQFIAHITYRSLIPVEDASILLAENTDQKWGLISMTEEKEITPFNYEKLEYKGGSFISYKQNNKWGLMNTAGTILTPPLYKSISTSGDQLIAVRGDKGWMFLDESGKEAFHLPHAIDDATPFTNGICGIKYNGKWGLMDKTGHITAAPQYDSLNVL